MKRLAIFPETELVPRRVLARSVWSWPDFAYAMWPGFSTPCATSGGRSR